MSSRKVTEGSNPSLTAKIEVMKKEKILTEENILDVTGREMPCAKDCLIGRQCADGYKDENDVCDSNIRNIKEKLLKLGYISDTRTTRVGKFFGIRVLDHSSDKLPFPPLADIEIKDGKLDIR